jgi:O-succinylbenzoic acid--CoA ligase
MRVDWSSDANLVLMNPRLPEADAGALRALVDPASSACAPEVRSLQGHVFLLTSGTTAQSATGFKWVALAKAAILAASAASNEHLRCTSDDVWLHSLPDFHIGGLSIWARAMLSDARVIKSSSAASWDPQRFAREAHETGATLCSLVPTQVHDLVRDGVSAPESLRAILLGGGASSADLVTRARALGWPVLPTYGMTETASQVATAALDAARSPSDCALHILPHLEVVPGDEDRLRIRGSSLLTGYVIPRPNDAGVLVGHFADPKQDGWFATEDFGRVEGDVLHILGRVADRIKIGGETVHLGRLEALLDEEATRSHIASRITLVASPDERLESIIHAVAEAGTDPVAIQETLDRFNARVLPFERARALRMVPSIPRTALGKIKRAELRNLVASAAPSPSGG